LKSQERRREEIRMKEKESYKKNFKKKKNEREGRIWKKE
jgi:hypothetical protein